MSTAILAASAFGPDPGRWPLPPATDAEQLWLRAVAAGGQGRYSSARVDLDDLAALEGPTAGSALASLGCSTRGSLWRQQGWHERARGWDGQAMVLAAGDPQAVLDALTGLAADALGVGRSALSAVLLERAAAIDRDSGAGLPARTAVRLAWVRAELAMVGGDGRAAVDHALAGVRLVRETMPDGYRHQVKSEMVLAAALCCAGDLPAARATADAALDRSEALGLQPLRWALSRLLGDIGSVAHSPEVVAEIRADSVAFLTRHGARLRDR